MSIASSVTIDPATSTSDFSYVLDAGITRVLHYEAGFIAFDAIPAPIVINMTDFQALVTDVGKWIETIRLMVTPPLSPKPSIAGETFGIGAKVGDTWEVSSGLTYYGPEDGTMLFSYDPLVGVTLHPRDAIRITYGNLVMRNQRANDMITAALTGQRPKIGASVVGPPGPPGPQGPQGDPLSVLTAYPVGTVYTSLVDTDPALLFGGVWQRIARGRLLVGQDDLDPDFLTPGQEGGAKAHTLTVDEIPAHTHRETTPNLTSGTLLGFGPKDTSSSVPIATDYYTEATGGGQPHSNLPPYLVVFMWQRVA